LRRSKSDYVIQTVVNALRLLEAFQEDEVLGVTELSRRLELHKNNVFRLLATLEQSHYVEQCEDDRYRLGTACLELGHSFSRTRSLARQARPVLEELCGTTGETIHLGVLADFDVMHLDGEQPDQLVVTRLRTGGRLSAHCTALGKTLLAALSPQELEQIDKDHLGAGALIGETPTTITDRDKFIEHLRGVGAQGWAVDLEECEPGLCCVAAPVHDEQGVVVAAISLSAPTFRASESVMVDRVAPQVVEAANRLSRRLGWAE
jgi:DNA-binding IclR family transcriptional regulator